MKGDRNFLRASLLVSGAIVAMPQTVFAQEAAQQAQAPSSEDMGEIIVTARKRSETLISVPVAITAVTATELQRGAINGTDALARKIPGFVVGEGGGTVQGGAIALRGISAADSNPLGDQAVSFNIDGVQVARASIRRMGDFDLASVEVLKGPQALFYGKNSPGGIISTKTADPTDHLEVGGKVGYEFVADELRGEGYISAPLSDSLGIRIAGYGSTMKGWVKNLVPTTDPLYAGARTPRKDEYAFRATLKFNDNGPFRARFKLAFNDVKDNSSTANVQTVDCPTGVSASGPISDCKADDFAVLANLGTAMAQVTTLAGPLATAANPSGNPDLQYSDFGDGVLMSHSQQVLSGLELNYDLTPELQLTSVTGFYDLSFFNRANFSQTNLPAKVLGSINHLYIREVSEEIRLASSFSGPINFLVGGQYQHSKAITASIADFGAVTPVVASNYAFDQRGNAYSLFGQIQFKPFPQVEISAGGRYSHEQKRLVSVVNRAVQLVDNPTAAPFLANGLNKRSFNNFSPEVSVSYRPSSDLTIYANYKQGFLSGGFSGGSPVAGADFSYRPQTVKGFEGGIKGRFLDGLVSTDLALYSYKINDLQVTVATGTVQVLRNAGKVSSKGAEFSLTVRPTKGLSLYGNVAYSDGKYDQYYASCYAGQTAVAPGTGIGQCAAQPDPTNNNAVSVLSNLSGTQLIRSPKWAGNAGFTYETPLTGSTKIELAAGISYSDSYIAHASSKPRTRQPSYTLVDASVRLAQSDDRWDISLIGKNLTNKFYYVRATDNPGGTNANNLSDSVAAVSRGREVMLRVGFKY